MKTNNYNIKMKHQLKNLKNNNMIFKNFKIKILFYNKKQKNFKIIKKKKLFNNQIHRTKEF